MLSAPLTCASSCCPSSQCCPSPAVPVTPSLCPVLPPHSQLVLSCASQDLLSPWSQERPASLSLPVSGLPPGRASLRKVLELQAQPCPRSMVLMPRRDRCRAGNAPGIPLGEDGPLVYPQCFEASTLHTPRAGLPSAHSTAERREQGISTLDWDGAGEGVVLTP